MVATGSSEMLSEGAVGNYNQSTRLWIFNAKSKMIRTDNGRYNMFLVELSLPTCHQDGERDKIYTYIIRKKFPVKNPLHVGMELKKNTYVGYSSYLSSLPSFCIGLVFFVF